jgi:hypothetical protein
MTRPLNARVLSRKNGRMTMELDDGQRMCFPEDACDGSPAPGENIRILAATGAAAPALARHIINELLGTSEEREPHV